MPRPVKPAASTAFPRRRERARATRARVLDAARDLFIERGYVATTVDAIAQRADVSPETIYATFGTKRAVIAEVVDVSIAGGQTAVPILEQPWITELRDEPNPRRRVAILARNGRMILERRAAIDEVVRAAAAADPEVAALWARGKAQRFAGQREIVRIVFGSGGLRPGLDLAAAADILYAIGSPETYRHLVIDRGWSGPRFERWYAETLERLLLKP
jgi:AcrR family transcriptional regulator